MKTIENNDINKVNKKSFQTLSTESYDFSNNIQQSTNFLSFINNSFIFKCLNYYNQLKNCVNKSVSFSSKKINQIILILNIFGFILYYISLIGCHKGEQKIYVLLIFLFNFIY